MLESIHFFSTNMPLDALARLRKESCHISLKYNNVLLLINISFAHQVRTNNYLHYLLDERRTLADRVIAVSRTLANTPINIHPLICHGQKTYDELVQIQMKLQQSNHVHHILTIIMRIGCNAHQLLHVHHDNHDDIKQHFAELQRNLENALQAMSEVSQFTTSLTSITEKTTRINSAISQSDGKAKHENIAVLLEEIQLELNDLYVNSSRQTQNHQSLMWEKITETEYLKATFFGIQQKAAYESKTVWESRRALDYLNTEIQITERNLAWIENHLADQRQLAFRLSSDRLKLQDKLQEELKKQLAPFSTATSSSGETNTYQRVLKDINPITIQDILVTHPPMSRLEHSGEVSFQAEEKGVCLTRMLLQIELLANFAKEQHKKNCNVDGSLKEESQNCITRLITDEFSFYPFEPLTTDNYVNLIKEIREIARKLPLNIHLILSTFPVLNDHHYLHNITLHITSGEEPLIHHHSKAIPSRIDPDYGYPLAQNYLPWLNPKMPLIDHDQPLYFDFGSIVYSETAGGARMITNVTICRDHEYKTGLHCLHQVIKWEKHAREIIPVQYSNILCSRTYVLAPGDPDNEHITQADAINPGIWTQEKQRGYGSIQPSTVLYLKNHFGSSNHVYVFDPQPATYLPGNLLETATRNNIHTLKHPLLHGQEPEPPLYQLF